MSEESKPAPPADNLVTTSHSLPSGQAYTATTGTMVLREEVFTDGAFDGLRPKAEMFVTSYTLDGPDSLSRPVTFAFNGGPGSSSVWLHLGVLGPRRVVMGDAGALLPPPYGLADNEESLLAVSDLVFIDPVSTGYSRAAQGEKAEPYHGFTGDLQSRYGMYLNGVMLISSVLDYITGDFNEGNDLAYALYLPTYAAIAHYHGLHGDRSLAGVLREAEEFAERDYPWALARGNRLTAEERAAAVARIAALTGLSEDYVDRVNLRIEHIRFFTELLRSRRLTVGRLDGRFTGWDPDSGREHFSADPSMNAIMGPYSAALNHYLRTELGYANDFSI
ncbi:S10 family peptidase [Nonomuraea basaltis]|uniref:S10 family peptidase n=1 Tax=Nonomuraea basaltis TaxID=2495887 RepID=UPI001F0F81EE|nr:hypothetical protein [Nonomuraea basaltis]